MRLIQTQRLLFWEPRYPNLARAACLALVALIAYVDFVLPKPLSLAIFYLPVIFVASWLWGKNFGAVIVVAAVIGWLFDHLTTVIYPHPFYYLWDVAIRLITWGVFVWLVVELKAALLKADERFITLLKSWDSAVCVSDMRNGTLLYLNDSCLTAFGDGPPLGSIQQIDSRLAPRPLLAIPDDQLRQVSSPPSSRNVLECFDTASGRWYLVRAYLLQWINGQMTRIQIATDITEYRRVQEINRQQQEKLELGSRLITLGGMASALAHELNQPLAAIVNYNQGCVRLLHKDPVDRQALLAAMEKSSAQAERAGKIVQHARALAQRHEPELTQCDLNEIVTAVASALELSLQKHGIQLTLDLAPSLPPLLADRIMIEQAIFNLARNAIEAMHDTPHGQGRMSIRTFHANDRAVELQIADSGCGLPDEMDKTLFVPFFTTKSDGLGLGLNLVRSIAEIHGGQVRAARNPDIGSTFYFTLPVTRP